MSEAGEFIDEVDEDADDEMVREETLKTEKGAFVNWSTSALLTPKPCFPAAL